MVALCCFDAHRESLTYNKWSKAPIWSPRMCKWKADHATCRTSQKKCLWQQTWWGVSASIAWQPRAVLQPRAGHYPDLSNNKHQEAQPRFLNEQKSFHTFPTPSKYFSKGWKIMCFLKWSKERTVWDGKRRATFLGALGSVFTVCSGRAHVGIQWDILSAAELLWGDQAGPDAELCIHAGQVFY